MKKLLAVVLAAATVLSLGVSSFAATAATDGAVASFTYDLDTVEGDLATVGDVPKYQLEIKSNRVDVNLDLTFTSKTSAALSAATALADTAIAPLFDGAKAGGFEVTDVTGTVLTFTATKKAAIENFDGSVAVVATVSEANLKVGSVTSYAEVATGPAAADITATNGVDATFGDVQTDIVSTNAPLVESLNDLTTEAKGGDSVKSGKALFYQVQGIYADTENFEITVKKGENAKVIKSIAIVQTKDSYVNATTGTPVNAAKARITLVKITFNDNYTDSDYKVDFTLSVKALKDVGGYVKGQKSSKYTNVGKFWMQNRTEDADQDYNAGEGGLMLKPQKNEENEITWSDENNTLAVLTFVSDDNAAKFFPKLSTKWENADYAEFFADQNAFYFDFTGYTHEATKIASTSRATLEIYNPYYDSEEDELTIDPDDIIIYSVDVDGTFTDVTASFKAGENDDGDSVFTTKTRELGTYIFAEKVAGTVVDDVVETPDDGKVIPNTGR